MGYGGAAPEAARSWSYGHHGGSGQFLEHVDGGAGGGDAIGPELVEPRGEDRVAAFAAVLEPAAPLGGDRRPDDWAGGGCCRGDGKTRPFPSRDCHSYT